MHPVPVHPLIWFSFERGRNPSCEKDAASFPAAGQIPPTALPSPYQILVSERSCYVLEFCTKDKSDRDYGVGGVNEHTNKQTNNQTKSGHYAINNKYFVFNSK